jgi:hypothetical protein
LSCRLALSLIPTVHKQRRNRDQPSLLGTRLRQRRVLDVLNWPRAQDTSRWSSAPREVGGSRGQNGCECRGLSRAILVVGKIGQIAQLRQRPHSVYRSLGNSEAGHVVRAPQFVHQFLNRLGVAYRGRMNRLAHQVVHSIRLRLYQGTKLRVAAR